MTCMSFIKLRYVLKQNNALFFVISNAGFAQRSADSAVLSGKYYSLVKGSETSVQRQVEIQSDIDTTMVPVERAGVQLWFYSLQNAHVHHRQWHFEYALHDPGER
jgi:hypothetical protein